MDGAEGRSARRSRRSWPPAEQISPVGRIAGYTTTICASIVGVAYALLAAKIVSCVHHCVVTPAFGGLLFLFVVPVTIAMVVSIRYVARRPVGADGSSAWRFGLSVLFAAGIAAAASRIPSATCPAGYRLFVSAQKCIGAQHALLDPTSWIWLKDLIVVGGVVVGFTVIRARRLVPFTAVLAAIVWLVGMGILGASWLTKS